MFSTDEHAPSKHCPHLQDQVRKHIHSYSMYVESLQSLVSAVRRRIFKGRSRLALHTLYSSSCCCYRFTETSACVQVLLVGEFHDDPHAHVVEAELFNMLLSANGYPTSQHKRSFSASNTTPKNSSKAWAGMQAPDVKMGLTGAPNLWTALHDEDPVLQVLYPWKC